MVFEHPNIIDSVLISTAKRYSNSSVHYLNLSGYEFLFRSINRRGLQIYEQLSDYSDFVQDKLATCGILG
jgi:hypothetical protein